MATQGMVTIVNGERVAMKIVVGCDGYNAIKVADAVRQLGRVPNLVRAQQIARSQNFGCEKCRVIINETKTLPSVKVLEEDDGEELAQRFRQTFRRRRFNSRWERGTADHIEVVTFPKVGSKRR